LKIYNKAEAPCHVLVASEQNWGSHQSMRAEIVTSHGRSVVRLSRWKLTADGPKRTGQVFEFGAHRIADVARMISEVQRDLQLREICAR
jgi:hypothetical protein